MTQVFGLNNGGCVVNINCNGGKWLGSHLGD